MPRVRICLTSDSAEGLLAHYELRINGGLHPVDVPPGTTLLGVLRDDLGLTAARYGCGLGMCGACCVMVDGVSLPSCTLAVADAVGKVIVTVEGLSAGESLHPVQEAFVAEDAMQCGYCTSGMVISAAALLARTPRPSDDEIRDALAPHLCRCGVYGRAVRAVRRAAR